MIEGLRSVPSTFVQERLAAVLRAAMVAPGYGPGLRAAGLIAWDNQGAPLLVPDWVERFTRLPILTKAEIRQRPGQFLASVAEIAYRGSTSGSRGQAYEFFAGAAWNQARIKAREQGLARWGITPEVPILNLNSRLWPGRWADIALGGPLTTDLLTGLADSLRQTPMALRGYPSRLCDVASALSRMAMAIPPIHAVICTGEPLFEQQQQRLLEQVFQAPVVNEYGCHESAAFGMTCPEARRLHLDGHRCFYEVLDQHLITTDLWNETMPLIRYQSGDLVQIHPTPCPCGRPGPTVDILGRMEDQVMTTQGLRATGQVPMPTLPGLQHYRIQRLSPGQVSAWAVADARVSFNTSLQTIAQDSLHRWTQATFGEATLSITWADTAPWLDDSSIPWSDQQWATTITQQSLGAWLQARAMPTGEARPIAALLKTLVSPTVLGQPLPWVMQHQIATLAKAAPLTDPALEILRLRVLLLATSVLPKSEAATLYGQTWDRLQSMPQPLSAAAELDSLIPSLHLPTQTTTPAWARVTETNAQRLWDIWPLDPLNAHHLLAAFDGVIHRQAPAQRPPVAQAITPLLAVLVGDLRQWSSALTLAHLGHWIALVQGQAPNGLGIIDPTPSQNALLSPFAQAWLTWRHHLLQPALVHDSTLEQAWLTLKAATPTDQQARLWIERGYGQRVQGQALDPAEWLPVLKTYLPDILNPTQPLPAEATPWLPIMHALAQPLYERGDLDLAYRCLQGVALAPRQHTAFAALTQAHNTKQAVLMDLLPWSGSEG